MLVGFLFKIAWEVSQSQGVLDRKFLQSDSVAKGREGDR